MSNTPRTACASECFATPSAVASMYSTNVCSPSAMVGPSTTTSTRRPMRGRALVLAAMQAALLQGQ